MKKLQALYNGGANKIVEQAMNEKRAIKNLNFLLDLSTVITNTEPAPEEPKTFTKAFPTQTLVQNGKKQSRKNSPT